MKKGNVHGPYTLLVIIVNSISAVRRRKAGISPIPLREVLSSNSVLDTESVQQILLLLLLTVLQVDVRIHALVVK